MRKLNLDKRLVILLCVLAGARVFIYSAAFPFFNNVDEEAHFDLVVKYSQGQAPRTMQLISPWSAKYIALFRSPEYANKISDYPNQQFPEPVWRLADSAAQKSFHEHSVYWAKITNHESSQAPLYYAVAALWLKAGCVSGLASLNQASYLYWIRFLNVLIIVLLVWVAYQTAFTLFPASRFMYLGVPLLVSVWPQDAFYSIQSDVLSPLCFGLAFLGLTKFILIQKPSGQQLFFWGLSVAATVFVKTSNLPVLVVLVIALLYKLNEARQNGTLKVAAGHCVLLCLWALLPVSVWMTFNYLNFGDLTASGDKIQIMGWFNQAYTEWLKHPVFTLKGAWFFWSELMASFWRGEFVWLGQRLAEPVMDTFYVWSSLLFLVLALFAVWRANNPTQQKLLRFGFWAFFSMIVFMVFLSVRFDFGDCFYPSKQQPFFTSGRLISGALIPFLMLYVFGLNYLLSRISKQSWRFGILLVLAAVITCLEYRINKVSFLSAYNFFHL